MLGFRSPHARERHIDREREERQTHMTMGRHYCTRPTLATGPSSNRLALSACWASTGTRHHPHSPPHTHYLRGKHLWHPRPLIVHNHRRTLHVHTQHRWSANRDPLPGRFPLRPGPGAPEGAPSPQSFTAPRPRRLGPLPPFLAALAALSSTLAPSSPSSR